MDPAILKAAIEALKNGDGDAALALLEKLLTGEAAEPAEPAEGDPASATGEPAETPPAEPAAASTEEPPANAVDAAVSARLMRITGTATPAEADAALTAHFASARTSALAERRDVVAQLVEAGGETPATAWEGKPEDRKPVARLMSEPLESMRARVAALKASRGGTPVRGHNPPPSGGPAPAHGGRVVMTSRGEVQLTASEIKSCEETGAKLEAYAENKAIREAARAGRK